ncbi:hypothetical protein CEXT_728011 [Caerostris extrusa]|uniref:Uncharacterized protein n=1 Tax=Caerostris extrusa TaxID=172846 RepID=A0AAV4SVY1_CAEEX|nr:hypothetical protein CEXT_728011 [Caerostris extrusa]
MTYFGNTVLRQALPSDSPGLLMSSADEASADLVEIERISKRNANPEEIPIRHTRRCSRSAVAPRMHSRRPFRITARIVLSIRISGAFSCRVILSRRSLASRRSPIHARLCIIK